MALSFLTRWWRRKVSAEYIPQDHLEPSEAEAQFGRGLKCATAEGDAQDYPQAAQWYAKAALQNHALAQFNLAVMYAQGQGVARDQATSLVWLNRSAELGDAGAQYALGVRQHLACRNPTEETGGETRVEALKWVRLAAAQGYRGAERACEFVALGMSLEEVAEGGRRVAAFAVGETPGTEPGDKSTGV